ncbi:hypothetical protein FOFC_02984 [Fusarium oxysporum]|nr:hypothetical protein FOFC_16067 [Fusarium oxysporum]KAI8416671.1 hypothetical protein FOFC_02984 [Fusarium oxysporum]
MARCPFRSSNAARPTSAVRILPREPLSFCSLGCCPEHNRASTICLTG